MQLTEFDTVQSDTSALTKGGIGVGLLAMVILTKCGPGAKAFGDLSCYFANPARSLAYFFYGYTGATLLNIYSARKDNPQFYQTAVNQRVNENWRAHNKVNYLRYNLFIRTDDYWRGRE